MGGAGSTCSDIWKGQTVPKILPGGPRDGRVKRHSRDACEVPGASSRPPPQLPCTSVPRHRLPGLAEHLGKPPLPS